MYGDNMNWIFALNLNLSGFESYITTGNLYYQFISLVVMVNGDGSGICHQRKMNEAMNDNDLWHDTPTRGTPMKPRLPCREAIGYS